jgi:hypothetical protein
MKKVIDFKIMGLVRSIQDYANKAHDGNFTAAVIELCQDALAVQKKKGA